jgi:hypothetical protein
MTTDRQTWTPRRRGGVISSGVEEQADQATWPFTIDQFSVRGVRSGGNTIGLARTDVHARQMAAVPSLLRACTAAVRLFEAMEVLDPDGLLPSQKACLEALRAALAEANDPSPVGEEP